MPVDRPGRGDRQTGEHAQQRRFTGAGGAEKRNDLSLADGEVGWRDDLDAVLAGLRIIFFDLYGAYDRLLHKIWIYLRVGM